MAEQLRHLLRLSARGNLSLRVVPIDRAAGWHGGFTLLEFGDRPPVCHREDHIEGVLSDRRADIAAYRSATQALIGAALGEGDSRALIEQIALGRDGDPAIRIRQLVGDMRAGGGWGGDNGQMRQGAPVGNSE